MMHNTPTQLNFSRTAYLLRIPQCAGAALLRNQLQFHALQQTPPVWRVQHMLRTPHKRINAVCCHCSKSTTTPHQTAVLMPTNKALQSIQSNHAGRQQHSHTHLLLQRHPFARQHAAVTRRQTPAQRKAAA
jgi:hypothetical protein